VQKNTAFTNVNIANLLFLQKYWAEKAYEDYSFGRMSLNQIIEKYKP
jgi:hypothetical protein